MIHLVRMSSSYYWKQSNVFGLYGLDFILDEELSLWFLEANPNPQMIATTEFLGRLLESMLRSLFEIEYALYRSRMKRVWSVMQKIFEKEGAGEKVNYEDYKGEYQEASMNRFEGEYKTSKLNTFTLIVDEGKEGAAAYFGKISAECV